MSAQTIGEYIATLPPTPQQVAERAYVAERAPQLAALYRLDRKWLAVALEDVAGSIGATSVYPGDAPLIHALIGGDNATLGAQLRAAIERRLIRDATDDAQDEASEKFDVTREIAA